MRKTLLLTFFALIAFTTGAWADEVDATTHLKYTVSNTEVTVTGFADDFTPGANYALVIPDEIADMPVVAVGNYAFFQKENFTTLYIGKNVKTIGKEAFRQAKAMTSVTFAPDGVVETLDESAFRGCAKLTEFVMPNTVKSVGNMVLQANEKLERVTISNQLTVLSAQFLCNCPLLKTVEIPSSVKEIQTQAFWMSSGGLETITIPSSVTTFGSNIFNGCNNLREVTFYCPSIPSDILKDHESVKTIVIGSGVTSVGSSAFMNCTGLTDVSIANNVTKIHAYAFSGCTALGSVIIPSSVSNLDDEVFKGCTSLASVTFAEGSQLVQMTVGVFSGCSMLKNFTIPASVNYIGKNCFYQCSQLESIAIPASVTYLGENAFKECTALENVTFADGIQLETIPAGCFRACSSLVGINIPASVKRINGDNENGAFQVSGIQYVNFAENCIVEYLGTSSFRGCGNLTAFVMPNSVKEIGEMVLQANANLASVTISNSLKVINKNMVCNCPLLTHIDIPSSVTTINNWAFYLCTGLTEIVVPHNVHTLESYMFKDCSSNLTIDLSACSNVWELYNGNTNVTTKYSVPDGATVILPPGSTATGTNIQVTNLGTLNQDSEGYYLIGSAADFNRFATIVRSNPTANARLTANIVLTGNELTLGLGTDESNCIAYGGTFDGQGHTITLNYTGANKITRSYGGLFSWTNGATIQNLTVDGAIETTQPKVGGIVSGVKGTLTMQKCKAAVTITGIVETLTDMHLGGMIGYTHSADITLTDCMSCGSILGGSNVKFCADFFGRITNGTKVTLNYNLAMTNFDSQLDFAGRFWVSDGSNPAGNYSGTTNIIVYKGQSTGGGLSNTSSGITSGATLAQLADGTVAYRLQASRADLVWGQRVGTDSEPLFTNEESYRVYKSMNGGYTNDPTQAYTGLQQDGNGNYLIGSIWAWKDFADLVNTTPTANAKMTADINLGDDQTMIGDKNALTNYDDRYHYQGIFDGQGHTLTVAYVVTNTSYLCAPFAKIKMATIKNLHVDGTMTSCGYHTAGVVSDSRSTAKIENVWCSVNIVGTSGGHDHYSGIAGCLKTGGLTISDCLFTGSITTATSYTGHFIGYIDSGTATTTNSLSTATFSLTGSGSSVIRGSASNVYYVQDLGGTRTGCTQVTAEQITNGTIAAALQNGRNEDIWVQDPVTYQPVLKLFANDFSYNVPASGVGSFSSKAKVQLPDGLTAYYCKEYDSTNGIIAAVPLDNNVIPANTGVLIRGEAGAYTLSATNATAATVEDNALVAVTEATHVDATSGQFTNFMLSSGKFIKIAASSDPNVKMAANKAYLQLALGSTPSREFTLLWDEDPTKAISPTLSPYSEGVSAVFDLQGRKVANPVKGRLYIINGKVVKY